MQTMNLLTDPIPKLVRQLAIPATIGFFFNTMYNVVDTFFAGLLSTDAQAALSIGFPVFFVFIAVSMGIGSGVTAIIGNHLGNGDEMYARTTASQALSFGMVISVVTMVLGYLVTQWLFQFLGASGEYLTIATSYMYVLLPSIIFMTVGAIGNGVLTALGDTRTYSKTLVAGFFVNIVLSPIFMFGLLGFPAMGVAGAALATVLIQLATAVYVTRVVQKTKLAFSTQLADYTPQKKYIADISAQGFPASFSMMSIAIGIFVITYFIGQYGSGAVAAYGIATRIEQIALLPMIGINIAALAIISQNKGAGQIDRIRETIRYCFSRALVLMTSGVLLVFFLAEQLMDIFSNDPEVIAVGAPYLQLAAWAFYSYVVLFMCDAVFRGYKKPLVPLAVGIVRQIVLPLMIFSLVVTIWGLPLLALWWSIILIVFVSSVVYMTLLYLLVYR
jgi:putative MATE family efflux protein